MEGAAAALRTLEGTKVLARERVVYCQGSGALAQTLPWWGGIVGGRVGSHTALSNPSLRAAAALRTLEGTKVPPPLPFANASILFFTSNPQS